MRVAIVELGPRVMLSPVCVPLVVMQDGKGTCVLNVSIFQE